MKKTMVTYGAIFLAFWLMGLNINKAFAGTVQLPRTGQTTCYNTDGNVIPCAGTGQDGDTQAGLAWPDPRFVDNGDGTVTDNLTGLMWLKDANCFGQMTWQAALDKLANLKANPTNYSCGGYTATYSDWVLPNVNELESLYNAEGFNSAEWLNGQGFVNVQSLYYWSSSTNAHKTGNAWVVQADYGGIFHEPKYKNHWLWPVRTASTPLARVWKTGQTQSYAAGDDGALQRGTDWPNPRFVDHGDGTVSDNLTGLMWLKDADCFLGHKTWQIALDKVRDLNVNPASYSCGGYVAGYSDWRLPNRKELHSLTDFSQYFPAMSPTHPFSNVGWTHYWSSSTVGIETHRAWLVTIGYGYVPVTNKSNLYYVWPVRGGQSNSTPSADSTSLNISVGKTGTFKITGGSIPYSITTSNSAVATALVNGSNVTVTGISKGTAAVTVTDGNGSSVEVVVIVTDSVLSTISLISPQNKKSLSYGSAKGEVNFSFSAVYGANAYVLNLTLYDIFLHYTVPLKVVLTGETPGFSVSGFGLASYVIPLDETGWDALALYNIYWTINALSDITNLISVIGTSDSWAFKLQPSDSVTLTSPTDGTTLSKSTDPAPQFQWGLYQGASGYYLILAHVGAVGFDKSLTYPEQSLNIFPMGNTAWQTMDTGTWY